MTIPAELYKSFNLSMTNYLILHVLSLLGNCFSFYAGLDWINNFRNAKGLANPIVRGAGPGQVNGQQSSYPPPPNINQTGNISAPMQTPLIRPPMTSPPVPPPMTPPRAVPTILDDTAESNAPYIPNPVQREQA